MLTPGPRSVGYEARGAGAPIVLLHPFPFARGIWTDLADLLASQYRVIAVDARGFGETPLGATGYAIADLADDVAGLLDHLGVAHAAVLGMSMGGYTALACALRHPPRVSALVLADTRADADPAPMRAARDGAIARIRASGSGPYLDGSMARLLSPAAPVTLVAFLRARAEDRAASLIAGIEALRDRPDRSGELGAIRCPTLILRGAESDVFLDADAERFAAALPDARWARIEGAGHAIQGDRPAELVREVAAFLTERGIA